jgi:hypothetical protein
MTQKDEWKKSLENKIEKRKKFIKNVKELTDLAADAEERNKEDEAKLFFVDHMPEQILVERGQPLILFEKHDEERLNRYLPDFSQITTEARNYIIASGTTDSSSYAEIVETYRLSGGETPPYTGGFTPFEMKSIDEVWS